MAILHQRKKRLHLALVITPLSCRSKGRPCIIVSSFTCLHLSTGNHYCRHQGRHIQLLSTRLNPLKLSIPSFTPQEPDEEPVRRLHCVVLRCLAQGWGLFLKQESPWPQWCCAKRSIVLQLAKPSARQLPPL